MWECRFPRSAAPLRERGSPLWALNWPLMKLLLEDWPPLFARGFAGVVSAILLGLFALSRRQSLVFPRAAFPRLLFASFTNVFAWMGFSTIAMRFVTVGQGALIVYTMPIWTTLLAWPLLKRRPTIRDVASLVLGMAGVGLLLAGDGFSLDAGKLIGIALSLAAAVLFALGSVVNDAPLPIPPLVSVTWQVGLGCLAMLVLGIVFEHPSYGALSAAGRASFVYMVLVPMGACYLAWFEALRRLPPVAASTGMLLVPALAIVAAALILGEAFGVRQVSAIALTLAGVALAMRKA
ncbi:DMT family transporter [Xanthobacter sp. VTT E-85237]